MRPLALIVLAVLVVTLVPVPPASAAVAFRLPHETVSGSNRDSDYTLSFQGGGLALQSYNFADPAVRPICFQFWDWGAHQVVTTAYAMAQGARILAVGAPIPRDQPITLSFRTTGGGGTVMPWQTTTIPIVATPGVQTCLSPRPKYRDLTWLPRAKAATADPYLQAIIESAAGYWLQNMKTSREWAALTGVVAAPRPGMLVISSDRVTVSLDVLQEPWAFLGVPTVDPTNNQPIMAEDMPSAREQATRWRAFRVASAMAAGIAEANAIKAITKIDATSAPQALLEARAAGVPIVFLRSLRELALSQIRVDDGPTWQKLSEALAAGLHVITTQHPVTSAGWTGTPWLAVDQYANTGTYLGTLRGGQGAAAPSGLAATEAQAIADAVTGIGIGAGIAGFGMGLVGLAPAVAAIGLAPAAVAAVGFAAVGLGIGIAVTMAVVAVAIAVQGLPGHISFDIGLPGLTAAEAGDGAVGVGGPAGSNPDGPPGSPPSEATTGAPPGFGMGLGLTGPDGSTAGGGAGGTPGDGTGDGSDGDGDGGDQ